MQTFDAIWQHTTINHSLWRHGLVGHWKFSKDSFIWRALFSRPRMSLVTNLRFLFAKIFCINRVFYFIRVQKIFHFAIFFGRKWDSLCRNWYISYVHATRYTSYHSRCDTKMDQCHTLVCQPTYSYVGFLAPLVHLRLATMLIMKPRKNCQNI